MEYILEQQAASAARQAEFDERLTRLVSVVEHIADQQAHLDEVMETLAEAQVKSQEQFIETDRQIRALGGRDQELSQALREQAERGKQTDLRIEQLVSAMGEFIRRSNGQN